MLWLISFIFLNNIDLLDSKNKYTIYLFSTRIQKNQITCIIEFNLFLLCLYIEDFINIKLKLNNTDNAFFEHWIMDF